MPKLLILVDQMRIDPSSAIDGFPVLLVRKVLWRLNDYLHWDADAIGQIAGIGPEQAPLQDRNAHSRYTFSREASEMALGYLAFVALGVMIIRIARLVYRQPHDYFSRLSTHPVGFLILPAFTTPKHLRMLALVWIFGGTLLTTDAVARMLPVLGRLPLAIWLGCSIIAAILLVPRRSSAVSIHG